MDLMCFSAPASFAASAVLVAIGAALTCRVKSRRYLPLALIPVFFGIQQFAEGIVWRNFPLESTTSLAPFAKDTFLFFAYLFWPLWIPASLWAAEKSVLRKQILALCFGIGLTLVSFLAPLIPQVEAVSYRFSIQYLFTANSLNDANFPMLGQFETLGLLFYGIATLLPLFISAIKRAWVLGFCSAIAGIAVYLIDHLLFVSLWCFFSALISLSLIFILPNKKGN